LAYTGAARSASTAPVAMWLCWGATELEGRSTVQLPIFLKFKSTICTEKYCRLTNSSFIPSFSC
jgi:hypothetical protein